MISYRYIQHYFEYLSNATCEPMPYNDDVRYKDTRNRHGLTGHHRHTPDVNTHKVHARSGKANKPYSHEDDENWQHYDPKRNKSERSLVHNQATAGEVDLRIPYSEFVSKMKEKDVEVAQRNQFLFEHFRPLPEDDYSRYPPNNSPKKFYEKLKCWPRNTPQQITDSYYRKAYDALPRDREPRNKQQIYEDFIEADAIRKAGKVLRNPEKKKRYDALGDSDTQWLSIQQSMNPYVV